MKYRQHCRDDRRDSGSKVLKVACQADEADDRHHEEHLRDYATVLALDSDQHLRSPFALLSRRQKTLALNGR